MAFQIFIQIFLFITFSSFIMYICRQIKLKDPEKPIKKTCILIGIVSLIAWLVIARIVWIVIAIQMSGN
ncbi:MAG: hypothetical protein HYS24_11145 [Ignavibacteriales bacterium]|nr:hypothetical protein [Ignavibacteriales bacterium]